MRQLALHKATEQTDLLHPSVRHLTTWIRMRHCAQKSRISLLTIWHHLWYKVYVDSTVLPYTDWLEQKHVFLSSDGGCHYLAQLVTLRVDDSCQKCH